MNTGTGNNKINPGSEMEEDENEVAQKRTPQDLKLEAMKQKDLISKKLERALVATKEQRDNMISADKTSIYSIKVLGEGAFGIVDLVVVETPKAPLLCVRKKLLKQIKGNNQDPGQEVEYMEACVDCDFVIQLWHNVVGLYDYTLLLEYCPYGTLQNLLNVVADWRSRTNGCWDYIRDTVLHLHRGAGLSEAEARFYIACIVLGLESMHELGLLHRDLKPDNCLIAENRYIKVADLGLVKNIARDGKGYSKAGTPGYMAPEVYHTQGKASGGYSFPADMWSLGVMLWEMVDGALPKWAYGSWYWTKLHFPEKFSKELQSLLSGLLDKAAKERLTIPQIKSHSWFSGFDWEALANQKLEAPNPPELEELHIHVRLLPEHLQGFVHGSKNSAKNHLYNSAEEIV